nr:unnamed protein product [Callosobruchus analis]
MTKARKHSKNLEGVLEQSNNILGSANAEGQYTNQDADDENSSHSNERGSLKNIRKLLGKYGLGPKKICFRTDRCMPTTVKKKEFQLYGPKKKTATLNYHLKKDNKSLGVCKLMFLNTLGIGEWSAKEWVLKGQHKSSLNVKKCNVPLKPKGNEHLKSASEYTFALLQYTLGTLCLNLKKDSTEESRDPEQWMRWFEELSSGNESPIKSELEVWDQETELDSSGEYSSSHFYLGKDKVSKRKKDRPNLQVRVRSHNIIKLFPGTKGQARGVTTEIECLKLFVNNTVIGILTVSTNIYIRKVQSKYQRYQDARFTNETEMSAFIGILILIGTLRSSRKNLHKIWDNSKGSGMNIGLFQPKNDQCDLCCMYEVNNISKEKWLEPQQTKEDARNEGRHRKSYIG